jgi:hypothetical protein
VRGAESFSRERTGLSEAPLFRRRRTALELHHLRDVTRGAPQRFLGVRPPDEHRGTRIVEYGTAAKAARIKLITIQQY